MWLLMDRIEFELQNLIVVINSLFFSSKNMVENKVPYVSQFAHPEFAEKILRNNAESYNRRHRRSLCVILRLCEVRSNLGYSH